MDKEATDPYLDYFGLGVLEWLAGGIRGYPVLDRDPVNVKVELNQWFRFDHPGHYRFYLKSHRLRSNRSQVGFLEGGWRRGPSLPASKTPQTSQKNPPRNPAYNGLYGAHPFSTERN
jgi:hypothetical protein